VIAFAAEAHASGGLRRLHHISTAYVEPDARGQHRNPYEQSKWEAERALEESGVPFTCFRPSIVMGDSQTGRTPHFRVLYEPIRWVAMGQLTALPVRPEIRLDVVPVDYVCDALVAIASRDDSEGRTYRLTAGPQHAISIRELIELTAQIGNASLREIGREPVQVPEIVSPDQIERAEGEERERLEKLFEVTAQVLRGYAPYALEELLFESPETREALEGTGVVCPSLRDYLAALLLYARGQWYA
jgi:long-chain acyl-CoA synthetase